MSYYKLFKNLFATAILLSAVWALFTWSSSGIVSMETLDPRSIPVRVKNKLCYVNFSDDRPHINNSANLKMIYYVTPTYPRPEQVPELIRLAHTLMHVPRIHWIVADDQSMCSDLVLNVLRRTGLPFTHLSSPKPYVYRLQNYPRGVANRRAALSWLRQNAVQGVLYFGDDDNTIDLQLFDQIRSTKKVSMFPVGLVGDYGVSSPIVKEGKVIGFFDSWVGFRTYPVDMAGFAVNLEFLKSTATMPYYVGYEEDRFLVGLDLKIDEIEPLADNCTKVLVWHTKTVKHNKPTLKINVNQEDIAKNTYFGKLLEEVSNMGMAEFDATKGIRTFVTRDGKLYKYLADLH